MSLIYRVFLSLGQLATAHNSAQGIKWNLAGESTDLLNGGNNYKRRCSAFLGLGASLPGSCWGRRWRLCVPRFSVPWVAGGKIKVGKIQRVLGAGELCQAGFCSSMIPVESSSSEQVGVPAGHPGVQGGVPMAWSLPFPLLCAGRAPEPHGNTQDLF